MLGVCILCTSIVTANVLMQTFNKVEGYVKIIIIILSLLLYLFYFYYYYSYIIFYLNYYQYIYFIFIYIIISIVIVWSRYWVTSLGYFLLNKKK